MTVATLCFVAAFAFRMPFADEWDWLPQTVGKEPVTLHWLWAQHNEHRMFLPRLIYMGLAAASGADFRAGTFFSVALLSVLSAACMLTARALRGRTSLYDAFFPLLFLHWAQVTNLIWGFQLIFILAVAAIGASLLVIVRTGQQVSLRSAASLAGLLLAGGLCGAFALPYLLTLAVWLGLAGAMRWSRGGPHARLSGLSAVALGAALVGFLGFYYVGFVKPGYHPPPESLLAALRTSLEFLAMGLGPGGKEIWPASGLLMVAGCGWSAWQLANVARRRPEARVAATGLAAFLVATLLLVAGLGWGRAFLGPNGGFQDRYITLIAPLLCLFYLQALCFGTPNASRRVTGILFFLICALTVVNMRKGLNYASDLWGPLVRIEQDMRAGIPPEALAVRYGDSLAFGPNELFAHRLGVLRDARLGPYRNLPPDAALRAVQVVPLVDLARGGQLPQPVILTAGQEICEAFHLTGGGTLVRIDVAVGRWDRRFCGDRLDWALREPSPAGSVVTLASGQIDLHGVRDDFATLEFPPIAVGAARRLELVLTVPADAPPGKGVRVPLFKSPGAAEAQGRHTRAFAFIAR